MSRRVTVLVLLLGLMASACTAGGDVVEPVVIDVPRKAAPSRTVGFDTTTFNVGVILDLSGPRAEISRSLLAGAEAYWSTVNAAGGVDGRFAVQLVVRDTAGSIASAVAAFRDIAPDISVLALVGDTSAVDAIRELAINESLLVVPATRQSTWGLISSLLPFGASYAVESLSAITWMARDDAEPVALCLLTDGSQIGDDLAVGVLLAEQRLDVVGEPTVIGASIDAGIGAAVDQIESGACERLYVATDALVAGAALDELATRDVAIEVAIGSEVALPLSAPTAAWAVDHVIQVTDAPSWGDDGAGPTALRNAAAAFLPDAVPNPWLRAGFASQYLVDVLLTTTTRGGSVTRDDFAELASTLPPIDTGGLVGTPDHNLGTGGYVREVTIHEFDSVGVDPLGLRPVERGYVAETIDAIDLLFPTAG